MQEAEKLLLKHIEFIEGLGYRREHPNTISYDSRYTTFYKPTDTEYNHLELPLCECNDRTPQLTLKVYYLPDEVPYLSFELEIVNESSDQWVNLSFYGIHEDNFLKLKEYEPRLLQAWKAIY